jgi:hypothetical protein
MGMAPILRRSSSSWGVKAESGRASSSIISGESSVESMSFLRRKILSGWGIVISLEDLGAWR